MSSEKTGVIEAMAAVMDEVRGVGKDGQFNGGGASFRFRGIDAVVNAVGPALRKHRVVVVPQLVSVEHRDVQTSGGKPARETCVVVKYLWTGPDGSTLETVVPGEAMDNGDKGTAKAMSVAFRIALLQALCLPTDDADPDQSTYERAAPARRHEAAPQPEPRPGSADAARKQLRDECAENGWDLGIIAARFHAQYGEALREATDANRIHGFTKLLYGVSDVELKAATNGVPA